MLSFDFSDAAKLEELDWRGSKRDKAGIIIQLKKHQRILRLCGDVEVEKELLNQDFDSAHDIVALSESDFVSKCKQIDSSTAHKIYKTAIDVKERTALLSSNLRDVVTSPHYRSSRFCNLRPDLISFAEEQTDYELINSENLLNDGLPLQSIFSPYKYLVELRKLIDEKITKPGDDNLKLKIRRPDLFYDDKLFDPHYAETELSYLHLVNEILLNRLESLYSLECNEDIVELQKRSKLKIKPLKFKVLDQSQYKLTSADGSKIYNIVVDEDQEPNASVLNIQAINITCSSGDRIPLDIFHYLACEATHPLNLPFHLPLTQIRAYLGHFKLTLSEIFKQFNVHSDNINLEHLNLSFEDNKIIANPDNDEESIKARYGITSPLNTLTKVDKLMTQANLSRLDLDELLYQNLSMEEKSHEKSNEILKRFYINRHRPSKNPLQIEGKIPDETILNLDSLERFDRLHRFIRLSRKFQWSFIELDWILKSIGATATLLYSVVIRELAQIKDLQKQFKLPLIELCGLWFDLKTYGRADDNNSLALFDKIFNQPMVFDSTIEEPYRPKHYHNPTFESEVLEWDLLSQEGDNLRYRQRIMAALNIDNNDFIELINFLNELNFPKKELSVENLSFFYRYTKLSQLLEIPMKQFLVFLGLIKMPYILTLNAVVHITKWANWLKKSNLTVYELRYLMTEKVNSFVDPGFTIEDAEQMLNKLPESNYKTINAKNFHTDNIDRPTADRIVSKLKEGEFLDENGIVIKNDEEINYESVSKALNGVFKCEIPVLNFPEDIKNGIYVNCGNHETYGLTHAVTYEAWINGIGQSNGMIFHKGGYWDGMPGYSLYWIVNADRIQLSFRNRGGVAGPRGFIEISSDKYKNKWIHIAFTWNLESEKLILYVNGEEVRNSVYKNEIGISEEPITFGTNGTHKTHFKGHISDVRLWSKSKTKEEIQLNMNRRLSGNEPGLVGYWPMDEGSGVEIVNKVSDRRHGDVIPLEGATLPEQQWKKTTDLPLDQHIVFIVDVLQEALGVHKSAEDHVLISLTELFSQQEELVWAAVRLTNKVLGIGDYVKLLLEAKYHAQPELVSKWLYSFAHKLYFAIKLNLDAKDILGLIDHHDSFGIEDPIGERFLFDLELIETLLQYKNLSQDFSQSKGGLLGVFAISDQEAKQKRLAEISGWDFNEIEKAIEYIPTLKKLHVKDIDSLKSLFATTTKIGVGVNLLHKISKLHNSSKDEGAWKAYNEGSFALLEAINSKYEKDQYKKVITPIENRLHEKTRDVLAGYTGYRIGKRERLSDLSDYLLIDLEMSGCAQISRMKSALNSLQMYVHQCRAGLEPDITNKITEAKWKEMGQYRVWEAHRKVETFPENYLDPGLRKLKSPIYEDIQQEILQGELTDEAAERAYSNYFEKFSEQANLEPIDAYYAHVINPHTGDEEKTIFIIGRARTKPNTYYVRKAIVGVEEVTKKILITRWTPWESLLMSGSILAKTVTPIYAFEKLFLFWVEFTKEKQTKTKGDKSLSTTATFAHIQYIYEDNAGQWSSPQTLIENVLINIDTQEDTPDHKQIAEWFKDYKKSDIAYNQWMLSTDLDKIYWKKISALYLPEDEVNQNRILITYGEHTKDGNQNIKYVGPTDSNDSKGIVPIILNEDLTMERQTVKMQTVHIDNADHKVITKLSSNKTGNSSLMNLVSGTLTNALLGNFHHEEVKGTISPVFKEPVHANADGIPVKNILGWTMFHNEDEAFMVFPETHEEENSKIKSKSSIIRLPEISSRTVINIVEGHLQLKCLNIKNTKKKSFVRLTTHIDHPLAQRLAAGGHEHLLKLDAQLLQELPFDRFLDTESKGNNEDNIIRPKNDLMDFSGPYGTYFWEIFFHIPFLLAKTLHSKQRFEESKKWFNYIYDPYHPENLDSTLLQFYWPFEGNSKERVRGGVSVIKNVTYPVIDDLTPYGPRQVIQFSNNSNGPLGRLFSSITKFTIDFWFKIDKKIDKTISILYQPNENGMSIQLEANTNKLLFGIDRLLVKTKSSLSVDKWHHCAFAYNKDPKTVDIYLDGINQEVDSQPSEHTGISEGSTVVLWKQETNTEAKGLMADFAIWNTILAKSEIRKRSTHPWRMWRFLPLRNSNKDEVIKRINNPNYLSDFAKHPLDAEAICRLKIGSFQKAIVMRYVDNLLEWGDSLFTKDSWETNILAALVYVQGEDIIGPRPTYAIPVNNESRVAGYRESNGNVNQAMNRIVNLEQMILPVADTATLSSGFSTHMDSRFYTPENEELVAYWDLVDDRLFKLRHCMNIEGVYRMLAEYQAPIDPRQIVERLAGSESHGGISGGSTTTNFKFPHYMERAMRASQHVMHLGQSLLTAIENKEQDELDSLSSKHEFDLLKLSDVINVEQIKEQEQITSALRFSKDRVKAEFDYHSYMMIDPVGIVLEAARLVALGGKALLHGVAVAAYVAKSGAATVPNIFGLANGGFQPSKIPEGFGDTSEQAANLLDTVHTILSNTVDFARHKSEHIANQIYSSIDLKRVTQEITASETRLKILRQDLKIHSERKKQYTEKNTLAKSQFTGQELNRWMIQRLSSLYMKAFKVAYDLAISAQKAYHIEHSTNRDFIESTHWDSLRKGLLAAEGLIVDLERLDKAYLDSAPQGKDLSKVISLKDLNVQALFDLKNNGSCVFDFTQNLFDHDFPGQYRRKIKSISISIEGDFGKSHSIQATLKQLNNCILLEPDLNTTKFLLREDDFIEEEFKDLLIDNLANQQIAICKKDKDGGRFDLNFDSDRYLPFEGTGAISKWELRMPKAANRLKLINISDVIIHLNYTAEDGGIEYTKELIETKALKMHYGYKSVSLRNEFPIEWEQFLIADDKGKFNMNANISESIFNVNLKQDTLKIGTEEKGKNQVILMPIFSQDASQVKKGEFNMTLNDSSWNTKNGMVKAPERSEEVGNFESSDWPIELSLSKLSTKFIVEGIDSSLLCLDEDQLMDIFMIIPYEGELDWSGLLD